MSFQLNSKSICLTYSNVSQQQQQQQCMSGGIFSDMGLGIDTIGDNFYNWICSRADQRSVHVQYLVLGREQHKDGQWHFHAGIQFDKPWRTKDARTFDVEGIHPSIEPAKNFSRWIAYCKKESVFVEYGTPKSTEKTLRVTPEELLILAKTMNKQEFLSYCSVHKYSYAKEIWDNEHRTDHCTLTDKTPVVGTYNTNISQLDTIWDRTKTLLLVGDSGIGKTTWCKINMPKPCLMVTHLDDLKRFEPGTHRSILFDDVSVKHLPDTSQIHLVDHENPRSIHIRYGVARIPAGIVKAFTCNTIPVNLDMDAIARRCQFIKVTKIN
jgi:hypothetical protein